MAGFLTSHPNMTALPKRKVSRSSIQVEHIRVDSDKPYGEVRAALEKLPRFDDRIRLLLHGEEAALVEARLEALFAESDLAIFSIATHGEWLQIISCRQNATLYAIGNVLLATQMTRHQLAAGLYAPLRLMLYENENGLATFEYDRPSSLFRQYGDQRVTAVAQLLDRKIYDAVVKATS